MAEKFSAQELLARWEEVREIKNLMGRLSADYLMKKDADIFQKYWSRREDVCLGVNDGWYDGAGAVAAYYDSCYKLIELESSLLQKAFPKELGGLSAQEVYGVGLLNYKPVDTPVIEVADDFQTAKGIWCIRGSHARLTSGGPVAYWEWGWFAVDFIMEDEQWKIWHMQYLVDICRPCGEPWTGSEKVYSERPEFAAIKSFEPAKPNRPCVLHAHFSAYRPYTASPRLPEPYATFADTFSYGI
ncbi:MAG: nuclear transport factor 2 family protein [Oscillospiraceae bacterium]|jgi:hypothetical protein